MLRVLAALVLLAPVASAATALPIRIDGQEDIDLVCDHSPNMRLPEECETIGCDLEPLLPWCRPEDSTPDDLAGEASSLVPVDEVVSPFTDPRSR